MESRVLGGDRVPAMVTAQAEVMPALGQYGIVADLDAVTRLSTSWPVDISYQVWAGPGTPGPEVVRMALGEAGIQVLAMRSLRARAKDLARQGPALALLLLLGVAASGMVVAALATLASALVQARRRAYEMAALRTAGIRNAELQGATLREYLVLLGVGSAQVSRPRSSPVLTSQSSEPLVLSPRRPPGCPSRWSPPSRSPRC